MYFFEFVLVLAAYFHDAAHIHFIESGEHGRGILCFHQSALKLFCGDCSFSLYEHCG